MQTKLLINGTLDARRGPGRARARPGDRRVHRRGPGGEPLRKSTPPSPRPRRPAPAGRRRCPRIAPRCCCAWPIASRRDGAAFAKLESRQHRQAARRGA